MSDEQVKAPEPGLWWYTDNRNGQTYPVQVYEDAPEYYGSLHWGGSWAVSVAMNRGLFHAKASYADSQLRQRVQRRIEAIKQDPEAALVSNPEWTFAVECAKHILYELTALLDGREKES